MARVSLRVSFLLVLAIVLVGCMAHPAPTASIRIYVRDGPAGTAAFDHTGRTDLGANTSALDQLRTFASQRNLELNTTYFASMGATFVNSIGGLASQGGPDAKYYFWLFEYNGKASDAGADKVALHAQDSVVWAYTLG